MRVNLSRHSLVLLGVHSFLSVVGDLSKGGVESVLDGVFGSVGDEFGNLRPRAAVLLVKIEDKLVFLDAPVTLLDFRAQMVEPSVSALLARSAIDVASTLRPLLGTVLFDPSDQGLILFSSPHALNQSRLQDLGPSVEALDRRSTGNVLSNLVPVLLVVDRNILEKELIFFGGPLSLSLERFRIETDHRVGIRKIGNFHF
mmetsp:Transcript_129156/g.182104  ORF Transcript_129156/g.182104 Transcript_129156/m.182104 type:complete len:200 (-) Transcript_129156:112-711(-)